MAAENENARQLKNLLNDRGWTLAVAESCTGGLLADTVTDCPGSSAFFLGAVIAYANAVKEDLLGVPPDVIARKGAVSRETALAMARGVRERLRSTVSVAVTGIAGPSGGRPGKPVGLVYIALSTPADEMAMKFNFRGNRREIKRLAVREAINLLLDKATE